MKTHLYLLRLFLSSIAAFDMRATHYSQSPPKVTVRRRTSPLRLPWRDAAMLAAILLPCAAIASPPVIQPSSSFNSQSVYVGASATFTIIATGDARSSINGVGMGPSCRARRTRP